MMLALALALHMAAAPATPATRPSAKAVVDAAPAADWATIPADDLMVIDFASGKRAIVWLASDWAPAHVANIRTIARAGWWSGASVYRVQDDYVAQWGDPTEKRPPAPGIALHPPAEYDWPADHAALVRDPYRDAYAPVAGFSADGWGVAGNGTRQWLPHCYAMVGVARDLAPDTGTGGDLYAVIGGEPRALDRNIAVVGRVIDGMDALSALKRGTGGGLGLYEDAKDDVPIARVAIASDLPPGERPSWQYLKPASASFAAYLNARANPPPPFFTVEAGTADLCNLPVPVRKTPG